MDETIVECPDENGEPCQFLNGQGECFWLKCLRNTPDDALRAASQGSSVPEVQGE